ncbi:two-component sensor histidine kinase [Leptolyngbya sp. FACHB-671]|uniref:sensor histidine kinase n=1 Tax=Leptolyngbya sp. FACHB-671 TaxID=2692812 RepID=UPI00168337CB|nr:ATP-binding protein [Leptolyngbya sp. FACHB-671]MBD1870883.1 two-component sensor histidine kinase [Cyanobacteria bacterium FACHB-471]MBD2066911.1 two-component sensor histidine kinase [Leptolyngbya sp. FACHB-671]
MFNRSRQDLARWFTLSMGSILVLFAGILYFLEAKEQMRSFDQNLYDICQYMAAAVEDGNFQNRRRIDLEDVPVLGGDVLPLNTNLVFVRWYSPERELIQFFGDIPPSQLQSESGFQTIVESSSTASSTATPPEEPLQFDGFLSESRSAETLANAGTVRLRQLTLPVYQDGVLIGYLQVAVPLTPVDESLGRLRWLLVFGVPIALGAIAQTGWVLGGLAMQPIRQSYDQLQRFTADASHELRAPLAAIINNAQAGLMDLTDPQEQQLRLEKIISRAESMAALVSQLLFLARNEAQLKPDSLRTVDLTRLLRSLTAEYTPQAAAKELQLICELPEQLLMLRAELALLRQAITNLLTNALQYTPAGGTVTLSAIQQTQQIVIRVQDTGVGISAEDLPQVFERFYRVDQVRSRHTGGFGLGLAIVQQIIHAHQGKITATSKIGEGTTFQIELPLNQTS